MFLHRILGFYHNKWNYRCLGIVPCNGTGHNRIIDCWAEMEMCQKSQLGRRTTNECLVLLFLQITTEFHRCFRSPGCCLFLYQTMLLKSLFAVLSCMRNLQYGHVLSFIVRMILFICLFIARTAISTSCCSIE